MSSKLESLNKFTSNDFQRFKGLTAPKGGLFRVNSPRGGSTQFSLSYVNALFEQVVPSSPSLASEDLPAYCAWISNEVVLYPPALSYQSQLPLSQWVLIKPGDPNEAWRVGLEAVNTGLFGCVFLHPSQACQSSHLRRLQIAAERTRSKVFLLGRVRFPHWMLTSSIEVDRADETDFIHSQLVVRGQSCRGVPFAYAQGE